ncbi:hypothetical protein [Streptomyces sp. HUAS TT7]|uniref:hypothetical protein n=1 Tax=Streptomyces sp. HUAS TT7 TaxID=3447507 RepID=UPI003F6599AD
MRDFLQQYRGGQWAPRDGWQPDREVILAVRSLITDTLGGTAEDILPGEAVLPWDVGAAVAAGVAEPWICVRADLPAGLRADLWGFCLALAVTVQEGAPPMGRGGFLYVGQHPRPITRPGTALLAALILQRLGRRSGDTAFPVHTVYAWRVHEGKDLREAA